MLVLNKKRIIYILCVMVISFSCLFIKNNYKESVLAFSFPVSNHTIILDAGHGNPDEGNLLLH